MIQQLLHSCVIFRKLFQVTSQFLTTLKRKWSRIKMGETSLRYSTDEEESNSNCKSIIVLCFQSIVNSDHHYSIVFQSMPLMYQSSFLNQIQSSFFNHFNCCFFNHKYSNQEIQSRIHVAFSVDQKLQVL